MEHHSHHHHKNGLTTAFWLNLSFSIVEIIGGIFTNSTAIIADAFHDFMDAMAIGMAVLLEKLSGRKRTPAFSYGYKRFSLLSALGMSLFLLTGAVLMAISAIKSLLNPEAVHSVGMLWLAVLGIAVNGFAFLRIKSGGSHHHAHHHAHAHGHNHNSRAIMLHLLEDVLGWAAVLAGAIVIYFTGWFWIDGVLALAIAAFIGYNATRNLISTMKVLLQAVPENVNQDQITHKLSQINGVQSVHDLHIWSLDGSYHVGSLHAVVNTSDQVLENSIRTAIVALLKEHNIHHPTIQLETAQSDCSLVHC
ncbi:cation diffusion facilitator family transporter [Pontibacter burrus]|uniref:Cation transporter n=1 Tax=Pontibacter burrus TaxID=2704466 RepID=A0A6B3LXQ2_9BACT|nr:cation diffusion facilitator family transporter [Pontibacter burrus]NEM99715.1 cation transporter [Pontibacter burrus]